MKPIRIFSPNIEFEAEISNYESLIFVRSWSGIGDLELRINRYKNYTETLKKGNIIVVGNQLHKAYIILHKEIELDEKGKITENWIIKALELKSVVGRRITLPPSHTAYDNRRGAAETVMKHYITNNITNPSDSNRKIEQILITDDMERGRNVNWQSRFKNLAEEMTEISLFSGIGWQMAVDYEFKKWIFDVSEGRNLTVNQTVNNPVIFSPQFDNIKNMSFSDSDLNYRNTAYVAGQGEGVDRRVLELGESQGLSRFELFVDARDVAEETDDDEPRPPSEIVEDLTSRGEQKLSELDTEIFLEAQIMTPYTLSENWMEQSHIQPVEEFRNKERIVSTFAYETDWDIGDVVTIQNKDWGITLNTRITEVKETYEPSGFQLEATYGNNRPTLIDKIKQSLTEMGPEIRR